MLQRSPILRFALEVFEHALESAVSGRPRDRKLAVINLAQAVELSVKAALVENNVSIYTKDSKTVNSHEALRLMAGVWALERIAMHSRLEVLIDERNAIQHRYGDVDDVTLDYHLETAFNTISEILKRDFDIDLSDWVRDNVEESIWKRVRFVEVATETSSSPSEASLPDRSATLDLVDGFSRYESAIRAIVSTAGTERARNVSTLDFVIKTLAAADEPPRDVIKRLPDVYKLRNRVIHGEGTADDNEVAAALIDLDAALAALKAAPEDLVKRALATVRLGVRGARVLSADEIQRQDEAARHLQQPTFATNDGASA